MKGKTSIVAVVTCLGCIGGSLAIGQSVDIPAAPTGATEPGRADGHEHWATLEKHCFECHNTTDWAGGLALDTLTFDDLSADAETWEKVVRQLRTESMPPAGKPRPDAASYKTFAAFLESRLDAAAAERPNPGRPAVLHRLNRVEYANAIRDLLALEIDSESLLPPDEAGAGFDNNGEILSVSALLMERYLIAARQISRVAVGDPTLRPMATTFTAPKASLQLDRASEDLPFGSRGGMAVKHTFPLDGEYSLKIRLQRTKGIEGPRIIGLGERRFLDVRIDGERVKLFEIGGEQGVTPEQVESQLEVRFQAKAGSRLVGVTFLDEGLAPEGMLRPLQAEMQLKGWGPRDDARRPPGVESVAISGPYEARGVSTSASRERIFVCRPSGARNEERCAREILGRLARLAYRRPVTSADVDSLLEYFKAGRNAQKQGDRFEEGIRMALEIILVSPDFLFRMELDDAGGQDDGPGYRAVSDLELASRLSFFLWSSIPDDELLRLAENGKLKDPSVLEQQAQRMLVDPRAKSLVDNFFGQWLGLRTVKTHAPDIIAFPEFDEDLREALQKETDLFFASMLREDRSVMELLTADYTYLNERLARHYGIDGVHGSHFRRVKLADEQRRGIFGKGAILMATSLPNRTSPVLRGKWVMENVMGAPPPPPPPDVPALPEDQNDYTRLTMRQKLELHRQNPTCASCHARMDPIGFALENFDAIGQWRHAETMQVLASPELPVMYDPVDASGTFLDGSEFRGVADLRNILLRNPENFVHVVTEKLLTYALGRGLEYYDAPAVRQIIREAEPSDYRWSAIVRGIVRSVPFRMRAVRPEASDAASQPEIQASLQ